MTSAWHLKHEVHGDKPWAVQAEANRLCNGRPTWGHWLEQGLGKTALIQNEFIDQDDTDLHMVFAPGSFKLDWVLAPQEWGVGWLPTGYWPKHKLPFQEECMQYAMHYEAMRQKDTLAELIKLFEQRRVMMTVDESTVAKNHSTDTARALIELAKRAKVVRQANGTPLTQTVMDYYGQLRVLRELNGWNPYAFKNRFAVMGGYMGRQFKGVKNEDQLAKILNECTFRALKKDWRKDLPPKNLIPVHIEMHDKQRRAFATMMEEFYAEVQNDTVSVDLILTRMDKLRQISSGMLMDKGKHWWLVEPKDNPKVKAVNDLQNSSPGKTIIVHFYKPSGQMLVDHLTKQKRNPAFIRGGMTPEEIIEQKSKFNTDPTCRDIVCQQEASSRGHTLLGQKGRDRCSTMIFYENSFSYYHRSQMEDRNHRGEQDTDCNIYDLIASPADAVAVKNLTGKRDMASGMDDVVAMVRSWKKTSS